MTNATLITRDQIEKIQDAAKKNQFTIQDADHEQILKKLDNSLKGSRSLVPS